MATDPAQSGNQKDQRSRRADQAIASGHFWLAAFKQAAQIFPFCLPAGIALALANITLIFGLSFMRSALTRAQVSILGQDLLTAVLVGLACAVVGLLLTIWAVWRWVILLTAYASFLQESSPESRQPYRACLEGVRKRAGYLARFWLVASLYMSLPAMLLAAGLVMQVLLNSQTDSAAEIAFPLAKSKSIALLCAVASTILLTGYGLVALVVSGSATCRAAQACYLATELIARQPLRILVLSVLVLALNALLVTPWATVTLVAGQTEPLSPYLEMLLQLWMALSSCLVWPVCVAVFCRLDTSLPPADREGGRNG